MTYTFRLHQKDDCFAIRKKVFMEEQGFEQEFDAIDEHCTFITMYDDETCIGCARVFEGEKPGQMIFGRLAVLPAYRGRGIGSKILEYAETILRRQGADEIQLHAQCRAMPFYQKLGYEAYGPVELDETVEHIWMKKKLSD